MARRLKVMLAAWLMCGALQGCGVTSEPTPTHTMAVLPTPTIYATPTFPPTWTPRASTPTNTRVIPISPTFTPGPSPTPTRLPARAKALVVGIQDGRTIEVWIEGQPVSRGFTVRLLGVESPLLSDSWSRVAFEWLAREVGRQVVVLERGERERDEQGNLLRYVWHEGRMINVTMVQLGLATVSEDVESLRFGADLLDAQTNAKNAERGLWGSPPTPTPTQVTVTTTVTTTQTPTATLFVTQTLTPTLVATQAPTMTLMPTSLP